jgi:hypothetical protein
MNSVESYSNSVWADLGSPQSPSVIYISGWAATNIGLLNIAIDECFSVSGDSFVPAFDAMHSGIYMEIFKIKSYESSIRNVLNGIGRGTGALVDWIEIKDGDSTVKRANPSEFVKVYRGMKSDAQKELNSLIQTYRSNNAKPSQVVGNEWLPQ